MPDQHIQRPDCLQSAKSMPFPIMAFIHKQSLFVILENN